MYKEKLTKKENEILKIRIKNTQLQQALSWEENSKHFERKELEKEVECLKEQDEKTFEIISKLESKKCDLEKKCNDIENTIDCCWKEKIKDAHLLDIPLTDNKEDLTLTQS